jgi:hypothetical protein
MMPWAAQRSPQTGGAALRHATSATEQNLTSLACAGVLVEKIGDRAERSAEQATLNLREYEHGPSCQIELE